MARGNEAKIAKRCDAYFAIRGWVVEAMHGNAYQKGIPDRFLWHPTHGFRWVDYKDPANYEFTRWQIKKWPEWERSGLGVWIVTEACQDEYDRLFRPPNFRDYWKPKYGHLPNPKDLLEGLYDEYQQGVDS